MGHLFMWITGGILLVSNIIAITVAYKNYRSSIKSTLEISRYREEQQYLDEVVISLKEENEKIRKINVSLSKSNKELRSKLDKINNKFKQMSDHFKIN